MLRTRRLLIRPWTLDASDIDRVFDIYSRWEVSRWLGATPRAMRTRDEAVERVTRYRELSTSDDQYGVWAVQVRATGIIAGTVLFKHLPNSDGSPPTDIEVGWHLHPDSWGHGYATEAARGVLERGFAAGVAQVYAVVYPGNDASVAVCRRLGMRPLGTTDRWYGTALEAYVLTRPQEQGS
jgi:RimJ/RimL family protein N-acetyltransferase